MMITLSRFAYAPFGTYGRLMLPEFDMVFWTVELPWIHNLPFESCIPEGRYPLRRAEFIKSEDAAGYTSFQIWGVPGRSRIFLHKANYPYELQGCIGIGLYPCADEKKKVWGVSQSALAHAEFMSYMKGIDESEITITSCHNGP